MSYTFLFLGETQIGSDPSRTQTILAKKFGITKLEIEAIFVKGAKFERRNLTKEVAEAYQTEFIEAGAIGHIIEKESDSPRTAQTPQPTKNNTQPNGITTRKSAAYIWLKLAGISIVATMIADDYLQSALIIDRVGLDMGYWPLILAHIPLLIGCSILAVEKGWSLLLGILLGCFSLAGLSLLLILPVKGQKRFNLGLGTLCITIFSCGVLIYWLNGFWSQNNENIELLNAANLLNEGRNQYPQSLQSSTRDYKREQEELYDYMTDVIYSIHENEYRPNTVSKISDRMFSAFAEYVIWRKYQYFKHKTEKKPLPLGLQEKFSKADATLFRNLLASITQQDSNPRLFESKAEWLVAVREENYNSIESRTGQQMGYIFDSLRDAWLIQTDPRRKENRNKQPTKIDINKLSFKEFPNSTLKRYENHIEYSFTSGPLKGKSIAIGFYLTSKKTSFQQRTTYYPAYAVLSHNYPAKYLNNILQVFDGYTK